MDGMDNKLADTIDSIFYKNIMNQVRDIILVVAIDGLIIDANHAAVTAYGYSLDELKTMRVHDLRSPQTRSAVDAQLLTARQQGVLFRTTHRRRNGECFSVEVSSKRFGLPEGEAVISIVRDITEAVAKETKILHQHTILTALHETALGLMNRLDMHDVLSEIISHAAGLIGTPHGFINILDENQGIYEIRVGLGHYQQEVGRKFKQTEGYSRQVYQTGKIIVVDDYRMSSHRLKGAAFDSVCQVAFVPLKAENKVIGVFGLSFLEPDRRFSDQDIALLVRFAELASIALVNARLHHSLIKSEEKLKKSNEEITAMYEELLAADEELRQQFDELVAKEEMIRRMAYYDALTGLPNRVYLQERLAGELERARRGESAGAVLFIDLDDFKMINDTFGHSCGDSIIVSVGKRILEAVGEPAVVARVGDDEFIALLPDASSQEKAGCIADRLLTLLGCDYEIGDSFIHLSASIGIAGYPSDGDSVEDILKSADLALFTAKTSGKNTWYFYEADLQAVVCENMLLKHGLREAVECEELTLHYQPLIDARSGRPVGFEALLRWASPVHGSVPPGHFIPLAEESNVIHKIGKWVIEEACRFARKLADRGNSDIRVSVNISPRQLASNDFVACVANAIERAGISPGQLELEITESVLIDSLADSIHKLEELQSLGVYLALDDFGTGFSSLTYLRNLPVGTLKLDKSFIDPIIADAEQLQFVCSIVNMAHVLRLLVVAEGVETAEQFEQLAQCQCDLIQGYFFSRPLPEREAIMYLAGQAEDGTTE